MRTAFTRLSLLQLTATLDDGDQTMYLCLPIFAHTPEYCELMASYLCYSHHVIDNGWRSAAVSECIHE